MATLAKPTTVRPSLGGNEFIDLDVASKATLELASSYDENDLALYALGVGAARDPLDKDELKFVYEMSGDFQALPTYGVMPALGSMLQAAKDGSLELPGMNFGLDRLLHGEQYTELRGPMPRNAKLKHIFKFKEAFDKDPNAVVTFAISSVDENDTEVAYNEMTSFVRGAGGWGGERGSSEDINVPPEREPDAVIEEKTDANQTLLYRLSGDWNPLHADPAFAKAFGFDKPILHGLCTYGYAGRHVIKAFAGNDGRLMKSIKVRFAASVFPGETLETRMWKESDTRIVFETRVKERDEVVLKNAVIELYTEVPKPVEAPKAQASEPAAAEVSTEPTLEDVFSAINTYAEQNPNLVGETNTSFQFNFLNPDQSFYIDLKDKGEAAAGTLDKADVTLELDSKHLETLFGGDLAAVQKLYFGGELKISGNIMASNKLMVLQGMDPKLVDEARDKRLASGGGAAPAQAASTEPTLEDVFSAINTYAAQNPNLVGETNTSFQFNFLNPDQSFYIDLKEKGEAAAGTLDKADVTLELDSKHLETLFGGDLAAVQKLYFGGELKISGNIMASNKLMVLQGMDPKLVDEARDKRLASGAPAAAPKAAPKAKAREPQAEQVLTQLAEKAASASTEGSLNIVATDPDSQWNITLGEAQLNTGTHDNADATITAEDAKLAEWIEGKNTLQRLYQHGELRIDGSVNLVRTLATLLEK